MSLKSAKETPNLFYLQKSAIYNRIFALNMLRMKEAGINEAINIRNIKQNFLRIAEVVRQDRFKSRSNRDKMVRFENIQSFFILIGVGNIAGVIVLIIEIIYYKLKTYELYKINF